MDGMERYRLLNDAGRQSSDPSLEMVPRFGRNTVSFRSGDDSVASSVYQRSACCVGCSGRGACTWLLVKGEGEASGVEELTDGEVG